MSLCRRDRKNKRDTSSKSRDEFSLKEINLKYVIKFIRFICSMAGGLTAITLIGYILTLKEEGIRVIYEMVLIMNISILVLGLFTIKAFNKKYEKDWNVEESNKPTSIIDRFNNIE